MNLFEFFRDATLRHLFETRGVEGISALLHGQLSAALRQLQQAYRQGAPVNYQDESTRLAYMLHYAPKHAVIWRFLSGAYGFEIESGAALNSIGCGPGSEIVGMLEGSKWNSNAKAAIVRAVDKEPSWGPMLSSVLELYGDRTGTRLESSFAQDVGIFEPQATLVGSFVLSDMAREGSIRRIFDLVPSDKRPMNGNFVDYPAYTDQDGNGKRITDVIKCGWGNLKSRGQDPAGLINEEMDACNPIYCKQRVPDSLNLNAFWIKFS